MNWSSVKNLMIAILVAANLFLVYNVVRQGRTLRYVDEEEIRGAIELLERDGLSVHFDDVPKEKFKAYVYESLYSDEYYTEAAEALTGSKRELLYALPEGGISIRTENGSTVEFDTDFGFRYVSVDNLDASTYTEITADNFEAFSKNKSELTASELKSHSKKAAEILDEAVGGDGELSTKVKLSCYDESTDMTYLLATQTLDGYEVYSHYALCVFEGDELVFAKGRWYFAPIDEKYSTELYDQVNILFSDLETLRSGVATLLEDDGEDTKISIDAAPESEPIEVNSMSACYVIYWNSEKTSLFFIPAWQIEHNNGHDIVYNAANGTVYSSNQ
ncbi:MAG: hypothetical protein IJY93_07045 [Clostridia bacterium]|nr:hypothetical protein [Clostridia bacterium]